MPAANRSSSIGQRGAAGRVPRRAVAPVTGLSDPRTAAALVDGLGRMLTLHVFLGVAGKPTDELSRSLSRILSRFGPCVSPGPVCLLWPWCCPAVELAATARPVRPKARVDPHGAPASARGRIRSHAAAVGQPET